jgi:Pyridoxamine 5'-phosphate oxidase
MASWQLLASQQPEMAAAGQKLLYQYGPGLAFLATVRADGGPRLHPVCPTLVDGHLYAAILGASPKRRDLERDGRYALHTFSGPEVDDEFYVTGHAVRADTAGVEACERGLARDGVTSADHVVFEFDIERALWSKYETRPQWPPTYTRWHAS